MLNLAMIRLYCGDSGKMGFYNMQEIGFAKALINYYDHIYILLIDVELKEIKESKVTEFISILRIPGKKLFNHGVLSCNILLDYEIDVVHLQSDNQMYAPSVMKFCNKHGIKCYNYIGTIRSDSKNFIKRMIMKLISMHNIHYYKKFPVFTKTPDVKLELVEKKVSNVQVIPVGLDLDVIPNIDESKEELRKNKGISADKKVIIYVGRLEEYKNPFAAINLISNLSDEYYLILIGNGTLKNNILRKIDDLGVQSRVRYIEAVQNVDIHQYYKLSDFFVNFNSKEIFGMSILEAMYQRCIVVALEAPGPNYIVVNGITGYTLKSINDFSRIILDHNDSSMGDNARRRIEENFTWESSAIQISNQLNLSKVID